MPLKARPKGLLEGDFSISKIKTVADKRALLVSNLENGLKLYKKPSFLVGAIKGKADTGKRPPKTVSEKADTNGIGIYVALKYGPKYVVPKEKTQYMMVKATASKADKEAAAKTITDYLIIQVNAGNLDNEIEAATKRKPAEGN